MASYFRTFQKRGVEESMLALKVTVHGIQGGLLGAMLSHSESVYMTWHRETQREQGQLCMVTTPPPSLLGRQEYKQNREGGEGQIETGEGTRCTFAYMYSCRCICVCLSKTVCKEAGDNRGRDLRLL